MKQVTITLGLVLAGSAFAAPGPKYAPNLFSCRGGGVQIGYTTSSIAGQPTASYRGPGLMQRHVEKNYFGQEFGTAETELGKEITLDINTVPDLGSQAVVLVLPNVNLSEQHPVAQVKTIAIITRYRTSIGGPSFLDGQTQDYRAVTLTCRAERVVF